VRAADERTTLSYDPPVPPERLERATGEAFDARERALRAWADVVLDLRTWRGGSRKAFFDAVRIAVELDPPVQSERSWDALADSMWEGIFNLPSRSVLIIWRDAAMFRAQAPQEFDVAAAVLVDTATSLADPEGTVGEPKDVRVLISA
jgi:Barstar (barnase inhibitor)